MSDYNEFHNFLHEEVDGFNYPTDLDICHCDVCYSRISDIYQKMIDDRDSPESTTINLHNLLHYYDDYGLMHTRDIIVCCCWECRNTAHSLYNEINYLKREREEKTNKTKKTIPNTLRMKIFMRDNFKCVYCDFTPERPNECKDLCIDHIYPESKGGEAICSNLQTLCRKCNSSKGSKVLDESLRNEIINTRSKNQK